MYNPKLYLTLRQICMYEGDYDLRDRFIYKALMEANQIGFLCGIRIDPAEPEWTVAFIELPTGQVSWHLQQHQQQWDGHTTQEKRDRIYAYARQCVEAM
jgi:hypothetical protein